MASRKHFCVRVAWELPGGAIEVGPDIWDALHGERRKAVITLLPSRTAIPLLAVFGWPELYVTAITVNGSELNATKAPLPASSLGEVTLPTVHPGDRLALELTVIPAKEKPDA